MLKTSELKMIYAGEASAIIIGSVVSGIFFLIGVIDGFVNPIKCH